MSEPERELARIWLRFVDDDLAAAEALRATLPLMAAQHVQQAIEKAIKATLVLQGIEPPRTHDLKHLHGLLAAPFVWTVDERWLAEVSSWLVSSRYPSETSPSPPRQADVDHALGLAKTFADNLRSHLT